MNARQFIATLAVRRARIKAFKAARERIKARERAKK